MGVRPRTLNSIPAGVERQLVVGEHIGAALRRREVRQDDARHLVEAEQMRGEHPAVAGDNAVLFVDHELKEVVFISLYLYITLGAVILMKTAALHTQGIEFTPWGIAIVNAVVLGKFMLLGEAMKIGGRTTTGPLIWPTLKKALGLLVLLII
jgi:hypothetical protein